jgi:DNA-binding ferritin-like protein
MKEKIMEIKKKDLFLREQEEPETKPGVKKETGEIEDMISVLHNSIRQVQIFHWQTKSESSYAEHKALNKYYDDIGDLLDSIVESYQGKYDIITGYKTIDVEDYKSTEQLISYFKELDDNIEKNRKSVKESFIQNQIDTIQELIYSTLYKLRFLK